MGAVLSAEAIERFLDVTARQLRAAVGVVAHPRDAATIATHADAIAVDVAIAGDVRGLVSWRFPRGLALELARRLLGLAEPEPSTAPDAAIELASILTGRASGALQSLGLQCTPSVPGLHVGGPPRGTARCLDTVAGPVVVVLALTAATQRIPIITQLVPVLD